MRTDPVLASKIYQENDTTYQIKVHGGLNYIRGNNAPHFTITAEIRGPRGYEMGGCCHDEIEAQFPGRFTDLIALHLSDANGTPMHFVANGWYDLAGSLGGAGERYHLGNSGRDLTQDECLEIFARHCRIDLGTARTIQRDVQAEFGPEQEGVGAPAHTKADYARGRARWEKIAATMHKRFAREAQACTANHNLVVFGDEYRKENA